MLGRSVSAVEKERSPECAGADDDGISECLIRGGEGDESASVTILATPSEVMDRRTTEDDFRNSRRGGSSTVTEFCEDATFPKSFSS